MSKSAKQILEEAHAIVKDPKRWTQGALAEDSDGDLVSALSPEAVRFCALGAIQRAAGNEGSASQKVQNLLHDACDRAGLGICADLVNDNGDTRKARRNILKAFRVTIAEAGKRSRKAP
jgi:hypothetical protein